MANKLTYIIAIAMAAIGAGILWLYWSNAGQLRVDAASVEHGAQSRAAVNSQERPQVLRSEEAGHSNFVDRRAAAEAGIDPQLQLNRATSTIHSSEVNPISNSNSQVPTSAMDGLSVPEGAVFPISESIEAKCDYLEKIRVGCAEARQVLKKIKEERTDNQWAPVMEKRLRAAYGKDPGIRIRALACRSSVCAVESEGLRVRSAIWWPLSDDLFPEDSIRAYEDVDEGGEILGVSLLVFTRER